MVWDSTRSKVVLFGGMSREIAGATGGAKQDTWDWDSATATWSETTPVGEKPSSRYGYSPAAASLFDGDDVVANYGHARAALDFIAGGQNLLRTPNSAISTRWPDTVVAGAGQETERVRWGW